VARIGWGRRTAGLAIDWLACYLVSAAFFGHDPWATLLVFVAEQLLLVGSLGASFGHVLVGLRVRRPDGHLPGPWRAAARAVLLALVIPAVVVDPAGTGLHDRLVGTRLVRREGPAEAA
jgi:uncharacterized RDD family membrane protein YckC